MLPIGVAIPCGAPTNRVIPMVNLIAATLAIVVVLGFAWRRGMAAKRQNLAAVLAQPALVERLYLRRDTELDAFWLHARLASGRKRLLAPPWELDAALGQLAAVGIELPAEDRRALQTQRAAKQPPQADATASARGGRPDAC